MGVTTAPVPMRIAVLAALCVGWAAGFVLQRRVVVETNYLDVSPGLLLLGSVLCLAAGAGARLLVDARPRLRHGILAGIAMLGAIAVGYGGLVVAYRDRFTGSTDGETPLSLLLEAWFWLGVPLVLSGALGAVGWFLEDRLERVIART